jgi:hypothetical protein
MKPFIGLLLIVIMVFGALTSCDFAKRYYEDNKDLIKEVIQSVIDSILNQVGVKLLSLNTKTASTLGTITLNPTADNTVMNERYLTILSEVVHDQTFWNGVDQKVNDIINNYKSR